MSQQSLRLLGLIFLAATGASSLTGCFSGGEDPAATGAAPGAGGSSSGTGGVVVVGTGGVVLNGSGGGSGTGDSGAFPSAPLMEGAIEASETAVFTPDGLFSGSLCVFEPHLSDANGVGALYPVNWLRPRFRWEDASGATLYEIRLKAAGQASDLVVYTRDKQWLMPADLWTKVGAGVQDTDISVTIRGNAGGTLSGMTGTFRITPALAGGSMVFWGTESSVVAAGTSRLYGFTMGDEAVVDTLDASQVTSIANVITANGADLRGDLAGDAVTGFAAGAPRCIGCHSATPDGKGMIFTDDYPWDIGLSSIEAGSVGQAPTYVSAGARQFMKMPFLGTGAMLKSEFDAGATKTLITTMGRREDSSTPYLYINYGYNDPPTYEPLVHDLIWIDLQTASTINETLPAIEGTDPGWTGQARADAAVTRGTEIIAAEGTAWGVLASEGTKSIANPSASKVSNRVAYSVSESSIDGHPDWQNNTSDIKIADLPATLRSSGAAGTAVAGASDPAQLEYYPAFSPDDAFIAFTRAPAPSNTTRCRQGNPTDHHNKDSATCVNDPNALGANPDGPYYNRKGEIFVVPSTGGTAHRLRGNDPVMCGGQVSPGVINSWPKWSSAVRDVNGKKYYFVIYSSARAYPDQFELTSTEYTPPIEKKSSQLYMSVIEQDPASGALTSYAAIYLWNQNYLSTGGGNYEALKTANMTPAWEDFSIPEVPPVIVIK